MRSVTWKAMMHWSIEHPMEEFQDKKGWRYRLNPDHNDWEYFYGNHWMPLEGCPTPLNEYLIPCNHGKAIEKPKELSVNIRFTVFNDKFRILGIEQVVSE